MTSPTISFGSLRTPDNVEELYAKLHCDDLQGWERRNFREAAPLEPWLRENIVHVVESCPRVLAYWKTTQTAGLVPFVLCRYLGAAMEGLAVNIKIDILSGQCNDKSQARLFRYIKESSRAWGNLSPSWIGEPGSDLRVVAVKREWIKNRLLGQVPHSISRPEAEKWSRWVPYAHSMLVFQRGARVSFENSRPSQGGLAPVEKTGQAWANAEDMALAQSLIKHMPHYRYTLIPHPHAMPVSAELQERMDALVAVHLGLGMMFPLQKMVVGGQLHEHSNEVELVLPALGEPGL